MEHPDPVGIEDSGLVGTVDPDLVGIEDSGLAGENPSAKTARQKSDSLSLRSSDCGLSF